MPIVFVTTNTVNGKRYLAKCVHEKPYYLGSGVALKHAIKKYGKQAFTKEVICRVDTKNEAALLEKEYSILWNVVDSPDWYNMKPGGDGGSIKGAKRSEETRKQISNSKKGVSTWNKGLSGTELVKHRDDTKVKISEANKGQENPKGKDHVSSKTAVFTNIEGIEFIAKGIRQFCREHGISQSDILWRLMKQKFDLPTKDGWKVRYEE